MAHFLFKMHLQMQQDVLTQNVTYIQAGMMGDLEGE